MRRIKSNKRECRLDKWKTPKHFEPSYTGGDGDQTSEDKKLINLLINKRDDFYKKNKNENSKDRRLSSWSMIQSAKEIIFDIVDKMPIFHIILHSINVKRGEIEISHVWDQLISDVSKEETSNEIRSTLAMAHALDVPVYPNTETVAPLLAEYYRDLMLNGFSVETKGKKIKYGLIKSPGSKLSKSAVFN